MAGEKTKLPTGETMTEFKKRKRKEFNEALKAMGKLLRGAAYMPGIGHTTGFYVGQTVSRMKAAQKELRRWWRNA